MSDDNEPVTHGQWKKYDEVHQQIVRRMEKVVDHLEHTVIPSLQTESKDTLIKVAKAEIRAENAETSAKAAHAATRELSKQIFPFGRTAKVLMAVAMAVTIALVASWKTMGVESTAKPNEERSYMPQKRKKLLEKPEEIDTYSEYAQVKVEIKERIQAMNLHKTVRFAIDGCTTYELEADGTMWQQTGSRRVATNRWNKDDWKRFFFHTQNSNLWPKLEAKYKRENYEPDIRP